MVFWKTILLSLFNLLILNFSMWCFQSIFVVILANKQIVFFFVSLRPLGFTIIYLTVMNKNCLQRVFGSTEGLQKYNKTSCDHLDSIHVGSIWSLNHCCFHYASFTYWQLSILHYRSFFYIVCLKKSFQIQDVININICCFDTIYKYSKLKFSCQVFKSQSLTLK